MHFTTITSLSLILASALVDHAVARHGQHEHHLKLFHARADCKSKTTLWKVYTDVVYADGDCTSVNSGAQPTLSTQTPKCNSRDATFVPPVNTKAKIEVPGAGDGQKPKPNLNPPAPTTTAPAPVVTTEAAKVNNPSPNPPVPTTTAPAPVVTTEPAKADPNPVKQTSTTTSAAAEGSQTSQPPSGGMLQKGITWNWASKDMASSFLASGSIKWHHNWDAWSTSKFKQSGDLGALAQIEYMPMLWGNTPNNEIEHVFGQFPNNVNDYFSAHPAGEKIVLSFNEPDIVGTGASSLDAGTAASIWKQLIKDTGIEAKYNMVSPAFTSSGDMPNYSGLKWYKDFNNACAAFGGCKHKYVGAHYYSLSCNSAAAAPEAASGLVKFMKYVHKEAGGDKPLIIPEFGCHGAANAEGVAAFQKAAIAAIKSELGSIVKRYAWYGAIVDGPGSMIANQALKDAWLAA